jgi:hypothetical protein
LHQALAHLERGEWQAAHAIVQRDDSPVGCWLHAIVHVMEGDLDNARYWYRRVDRAFCGDHAAEIAAAKALSNSDW